MSLHPATIGRYQIIKLLGSGAMGNVFLAEDPILARKVALKVLTMDRQVQTDAYCSQFSAEAKALARLDHPCIVQVYDSGEDRGNPWIAFQFIDGESLEAMLVRRRKLTIRRALLFAIDIASALQHAHGWNIIHCDVKPSNILIDPKAGVAKLTDFGIAQAPWSRSVEKGSLVGSPGYMSPEQMDGKEVDQRSDIFSLGCVLYRMISGESPFIRTSLPATIDATCRGEYFPLRNYVPEAPKSLEAAIRRCLHTNYKMRFGSTADLIGVLSPLVNNEKLSAQALPHLYGAPGIAPEKSIASRLSEVRPVIENVVYRLRSLRLYNAFSCSIKKAIVKVHG